MILQSIDRVLRAKAHELADFNVVTYECWLKQYLNPGGLIILPSGLIDSDMLIEHLLDEPLLWAHVKNVIGNGGKLMVTYFVMRAHDSDEDGDIFEATVYTKFVMDHYSEEDALRKAQYHRAFRRDRTCIGVVRL